MKSRALIPILSLAALCGSLHAADRLAITVSHDLDIARPSETISVPWSDVNAAIPGALIQRIAVKDASGNVLPHQVTNIAPQAKDPEGKGVAYGELLFQHSFTVGEKSATFTVERIATVAPVFPTKAFARQVPERLDDFAWENDKIGHRTYGPALAAPRPEGSGKEVLVSSGLDVWCKRVDYPIVDRWYNKGHDHYHADEGEGMDMYQVGPSRGCGGTGVWDGTRLHVSGNYASTRVIAHGPVRAVFELSYDTWSANGAYYSEVKRFIVDAGRNLDRIETTFTAETGPKEFTVAVGLHKNPTDRGQEPKIAVTNGASSVAQWVVQKSNGDLGTAIIVDPAAFTGFVEDERNLLALAKVKSGAPLTYLAGAGWSRAGEFTSKEEWDSYVSSEAARLKSPVRISLRSD